MQFPGHGDDLVPAPVGAGIAAVVGLRHAHPAEEQHPAVVGLQRAGGVVVKAVVKLGKGPQPGVAAQRTFQREIAALVGVGVAAGFVGDALGTADQQRLAVHHGVVGALPHVAEGGVGVQRVHVTEFCAVLALPHQHAALVGLGAGAQQHVELAVHHPHLGVTDMLGHPGRIIVVGEQHRLVVEVDAVGALHPQHVLFPSGVDVVKIAVVAHIAGVVKVKRAVPQQGGPAVDAVPVPAVVRPDGHRLQPVVEEIPGGPVAPDAGGALGGHAVQRAGHVKDVVGIAPLAQAVGVAQGTGGGRQVITGAPGVGGGGALDIVLVQRGFPVGGIIHGNCLLAENGPGGSRRRAGSWFIGRQRSFWPAPCRRGWCTPDRWPGRSGGR